LRANIVTPEGADKSAKQQDTSKADESKRFWCCNIEPSELSETPCPVCGCGRRKFMFEERTYPIWRCRNCGHIYVSPRPSEAVLAEYYSGGYLPKTDNESLWENEIADVYDAAARAVARTIPDRGDLLDVGAAFGGFLERAAKDGWRLWGIEPNDSAFKVCRKRLGPDAKLFHGTLQNVEIEPASVDCIVMLNVIEHVREPVEICGRAFELLRPGGALALRWPQYIYGKHVSPPAHLHCYTRRSMQLLLERTGFVDVREHWAGMRDWRKYGLVKHLQASIIKYAARIFFSCTLGRRQIPFVTRLTIGRKPR